MKAIIVGAGEVGTHIASQLIAEQKDVVLIEKDHAIASRANDALDCLVINGEGTNMNCLIEAGVENAEIFVAATSIDEVNMISCLVASNEFNIRTKIARVRNVEYSRTGILNKSFSGIDYIVNPEIEAAYDIVQTVELGASSSMFAFEGTEAQLRDFPVDEASPFAGKFIKELRGLFPEQFIVAGVQRDGEITVPSGEFKISEGDHIYLVAKGRHFNKIMVTAGRKAAKLKRIIVVGGGIIGRHVTGMLSDKGRDVRLIEKDYDRCKELAALYPDVMVINGDISDEDVFEEENLASADGVIATTQNEELNILAGIYAKSQGVKRAVALIDKASYSTLAASLGIDSCISPKLSSVDAILKFIRRGNIKNVYTIFDGMAEAIEFMVDNHSAVAGRALKDLKLPPGCLIVAVQRQRKTNIPDGNFVIQGGDSVIAFVTREAISGLEALLALG